MFSVRLVNADSYQATPLPQLDPTFSEFRGTEIKHVPIVRVFGTTHTGEKTCLHLHGVFPYLYVPFTGDDNADGLAYRLAASLDAAINISLGSANSNTQHVYQVQRVAGIPFYGYHRREHQFFKVSFYNPAIMKKAIDLLQNGSVLNQSFQPHEAHIPFILQFMMDYNLHGMSMINLSSVKYRRRITQSHSEFKSSNGASSNSSSSGGVATTGGIITPVDELDYLPACVERQSICELEVDGLVSDILNRQDLERGIELNPGLAAIWEEERARRAQAGLACEDSQLVNPKSPGRPPYCLTDNDLYQQQRFNRRLYMVSQCNESTLSSASSPSSSYSPASLNQSSYPIETLNDDQLMNASNLPSLNSQNLNLTQHINEISSLNSNKLSQESKTSQLTNETSILDSEDIPLIEILMDLARDSEKHGPVDNDSILGTQTSAFDHEEIKSDNEDDDVIDFNLTCLDIDSMSPWGSNPDKSPPSQLVPVNNIDLINNINNSNNNYNDNGNHNNNYNNPGSINTTETTNINRPIIGADTTDAGSLNSEESQLPQLDGAGDLLSFLESEEDENIIKYEHQVKRIPEYQAPISTADYANRVRVFNTNLPCNDDEAFIMEEGTSSSNCSPMSQQDAWSFYLPTDADNIDEFVNMNFELLGSEFDSDYETTLGLNSLLEGDEDESSIGINLIVDNGNNECVPLEAVLNGDPCFTQTAEMDKSDLTELKDQYDSLLGSELVPIAYKNFRESDSCVDNNNTRLDSNDKCGQVYSNSQSQQLNNDNTSKEAASTTGTTAITPPTNDTRNLSSENVTPNIQEPDGKVNTLKSKYDNSKEFSSSRELATAADSSDYNCNLVARWEELQDLKFIPKRVLKKKGFVRPRKQILRRTTLSESMMARKRGYFRRGPANLANQVFTSDNNNTTTVSPVPDNDNLPNNLTYNVTQDVNSKNDNTTICNNNNRQIRATDRTGTTDKIKLFIENSRNVKNSDNTSTTTASSTCNSNSTSKTRLSADTRATLASTTTTKTSSFGSGIKEKSTKSPCSLDDYSPSASSNFSPSDLIGHVNTSTEVETSRGYCNGEMDNLSSVVGNPDEVDNNPTDGEKTKIVDNKHQSRYLSYYSSVNAHSGVPYGQNKHRHCLYSSYRSAFVKDYVFTVDQVWVIDKRKRGTAPAISASVCTKDCCRLPIVLLDKLNIVINKSKPKSKPKHTQANRDASSVVIDHVDNVNYTCDSSEIDMVNYNSNVKNIDKINTPAQLVNSYNNDNFNINNNNNNIINNNNNLNNNDNVVKGNKKIYKDNNNIKKTNILLLNNNKSYDSTSTQSSQISSTQNHDQVTDNNNKIITATATATTTTAIKQQEQNQEQQKNDGPVIIKRVFEEMSQDGTASKKKRSIILKLGNRSHSTVSIKDENKSNLDESFNENFVQPRGMKSKRRRLKKIKRLNEKVIANGINKESKIHSEKSTPHLFRSSKSSKTWSSIIDKPRLRSRVNNNVKSNNSNNQLMNNELTDACSVANGQLNLITSSQSEPIQSRKRPEIWCSISRKNIDLGFLTAKSLSSPVYKGDNVPVIRQKPIVIRHIETLPKTYKIKIYSAASNVKSVCESEVDTTSPEDSLITFQNDNSNNNNTGNVVIDNNSVVTNNNDKNVISNTSQVQQFSEFDTTLDVHLCDSIYKDEDDVAAVANEIFDTAAGGIVEEERISLVDCTANSSQESEQYTKAIAEANFYAGKNYTIDAISLEIPQCLFEEDSNSESLQKKSLEMITESSMPEISVGILSPSHVPSSHSPETPAELDKLLDNNLINGLNDLNYSISSLTSITDKTVVKSQPLNEFVQPGDSFNSITSHKFNPRDHTSTECNYVSSSSSSSSSSAFEFSTSAMLNNLPSEQLNFEDYFDVEQIIQMINSALILNDINLDDNTLNNQLLSLSKEDNICGDNNKVDDEKTKTKYSPNKISIIRKIYKTKGDNNKAEKSNNGNTGTANQADENLLLNPKQGIDLVDIEAEAPDNPVIIKPNNEIDLEFNEPMKIDADGDDDNSVNGNDKDAGGEDEKLIKFTSTDSINTKAYENNWNNQESRNEISSDCAISQNTNLEKFVENVSSEIFNQNDNNEQQSVKTITTVDDNENKVNVDTEVIKLMDNILSLVSIEKSMNNMYNNDNVDNIIDTEPVLNSIVNNNLIDDKGCEAAGRRSNYLSQSNEISTTVTAVENNTDCNKVEAITDKFCSDNKNIIESLGADGSDDHEETEAKLTNEKTDVKLVEPEIEDKITTGTAGSYCEVLLEVNEKVKSSVEQSTFESSLTITDNQCSNEQEIKLRFKEDYTEVVFNSDKENIDSHECSIHSNSIPEVEKDPEEAVRAGENKEEEEINGDGEEVQEDKLNIDTGSKSGVEQENTYTDDSNGKNISKESVFRCRELSVRLVRIKLNEFNQYLNSSNGCGNKSKIDANSSLVEFESGKEAANASSVKQKFGNSSGVKKCVRFDDQVFIFETNTRVPLINFDEKSEEEEEAEKQRENFTEGDEGEGAVEPECQGEGEGETERVGASEVEGEGGCDEEEPEVLEEEEEEEAEPEPEPEIAEQEKMVGVENQELEKEKEQQVEKVKDGEKQDSKKTIDKDEISVGSMKKCEITDSYKSIGNKNDSETKFNGDVIASSCINKKHDDEIIVISDSDEYSSSDNDVEFVSEEKLVPDSCVSKKLNTKIIDKNFVFTENSNGNTDKLSHVNVNGVIRNKNETSNDKKNKKYSKSTFKDINPIKDVPRIRSSSFGTVTVTLTPVTSTSTSTSTLSDSCGNATTTEAASLPNKKSGKRVKELATKFTCVSGQNSSKSTKTEFNRDIKEQQQFSLDNIQEMESKLDKNLKDVTVLDESTIPVDKNIKEKSRLAGELLTKFTEKEPPRSSESTCKRKRNNNNNLPRQSYLNSNNNIKANSNSIIVPSTVDPTPTTSSLLPGSMVESRQSSDDNRLVRTYRMLTSYRTKIHTLSIDQRMVFTRVAVSDQEFGSKQVKEKFLEGIGLYPLKPQGCGWKPAHITTGFMQLQQPRVILQRLTPSVLKYYGYTRRFKSQRFGKRFKTDVNNRFTIPAYDGPADLSSTDSESDTDITLDCREKRVCDYKPRKHFQRCEATVTPRKRKNINSDEETGGDKVNLGEEDLFQGARDRATQRLFNRPTAKHSMPLTDNKIYYQSPTRATTSKSSGLSGNYTPLKIIITSPKVRKLEHTSCDQPTIDNHNRTYSHSRAEDCLDNENSCVTPRRRRRLLSSAVTSTKRRVSGDSCQTLTANDERQQTGEFEILNPIPSTSFGGECSATASNDNNYVEKCNRDLSPSVKANVRKNLFFSSSKQDHRLDKSWRNQAGDIDNTDKGEKLTEDTDEMLNNELEKSSDDDTVIFEQSAANLELEFSPLSKFDDDQNLEEQDDVCNVTFTQYLSSQLIRQTNQSSGEYKKSLSNLEKQVTIIPKLKPPSVGRIIDTMELYSIPKCRNLQPFFSNQSDAPGHKEVAHRLLKVPGKGLADLSYFKSSLDNITGINRWRRMKINEFNSSSKGSGGVFKSCNIKKNLAGHSSVVITPLILPPSLTSVIKWVRARDYLAKKRIKLEKRDKDKNNVKDKDKYRDKGIEGGEKEEIAQDEETVQDVIETFEQHKKYDNPLIESEQRSNNVNININSSILETTTENIINLNSGSDSSGYTVVDCSSAVEKYTSSGDNGKKSLLIQQHDNENSNNTLGDSLDDYIDPSLLSILGKSKLFKESEQSKHFGISCGQIECLTHSDRSNVENENRQKAKALTRYQFITVLCVEVHVVTRDDLLPDPQHDAISALFYAVQSDVPPTSSIKPLEHGLIAVATEGNNNYGYDYGSSLPFTKTFVSNEVELYKAFVNLVTRIDPEIFIGWEIESLSWGYIFQRASRLGIDLAKRISRIPSVQCKWESQPSDLNTLADVKLPGRIVLDIWRIMRSEIALLTYTYENVMYSVMNERVPCPSFKVLSNWWIEPQDEEEKVKEPNEKQRQNPRSRWKVVQHYSVKVLGILRILEQLDIIGRTSEHARLFGIQFYEVFSRGSQYRVESIMLRLAKPLNYIPVSPSPLQRASMRAMEALPLIMEPEAMFYSDPLIVLDFQSLYPSIIIAHNYCFSTCLGRIENIGQQNPYKFGAYLLRVPKSTAIKLQGKVNYAPCGVAFVKPEIRLGILPRMLTEILETRLMVKKAMKDHKDSKDDKLLQRVLHSRQHGLKYLANVTYGYTAANFSGRMPCIELGDSVISKAKETLERAIKLVESTPKWGARVVYGDTDSLFILVPGKSKDDAFIIGNEIADAVTASNLKPIKLKFEKVLHPAILQTKKRYCGYMYETPDQKEPTYLAKGIETVRRDGCPAVSKILEKSLKILFDTKDVSLVKQFVTRQLDKVLNGKVSLQDLTFAKEFRGLRGYKEKACVPALELTRRLMKKDPRAIPRHGERVRYVIVAGPPNQALINCVRSPWEVINDPGLRPNGTYYVTRVIIPPLNRCLNLMGVDVNTWYREMPHRYILNNPTVVPSDKQKQTIFQYFGNVVCVCCGRASYKNICDDCTSNSTETIIVLHEKLRWLQRINDNITAICQSCIGRDSDVADCVSLDCPVLYRRAQASRELTQGIQLQNVITGKSHTLF